MVTPINYSLNVLDPIQGYLGGLKFGEGLQTDRLARAQTQQSMDQQAQTFTTQKAAAEKAVADAAAGQSAITQLIELGPNATANDFMKAWAANPAMRDEITNLQTMLTKPKTDALIKTTQDVYVSALSGNVDATRGQIQLQYDAALNSNDEAMASGLKSVLDQFDKDPEAAMGAVKTTSGLTLGGLIGFDKLKQLNEGLGYGVAESANVQKAENIGGIAVVTTMTDGTVQIKDARTNAVVKGEAADKLLAEASELQAKMTGSREAAGTAARLTTTADLGAAAAAATAGGASAVKLGTDAYLKIQPIRSNIANLDKAINLIEVEGANTGVIQSKLPNWNAATIELNSLQSQLGLDVVGAVTFGALSQGELGLALQVALPTDLDGPDLANWLRSKKAAQEKLADYFTEQSKFFSRGYPPGQWFDFVDSGEKDINKWMKANRPNYGAPTEGQQTPAPAATETPTAPETPTTATSASETEDKAFMQSMIDKSVRGETLTQAEMNRVNVIAAKGK